MYDWELTSVRDAMEGVMPDTCDVYRRSGSGDAYGGGADWGAAPAIAGLKCQVLPLAVNPFSETVLGSGRETDTTYFELAFPYGTDVRQGDKVVVSTLGGTEFILRQVETPESWDAMVTAQGVQAA